MDLKKSGEKLLKWHEKTERDLPWKGETDAYRIWVSETMLQQTRAAVVAGRYREFLAAFPDVQALAMADEQDVLRLWQGLGYYARARNLHKAAQQVCQRHDGVFPDDERALRELAGVGEYTACAILSMAYGRPEAAIDANLARVISRVFGIRGYVEDNRATLRQTGEQWLRACAAEKPGDFNRALMGLGALVCTAKRADCACCPLAEHCEAFAYGEQELLPEKRPKKGRKEEYRALAVAFSGEKVLVRQRPETGMLAGLWEFPHFQMEESAIDPQNGAACLREEGFEADAIGEEIARSDFVFTHRVWRLRAYQYRLKSENAAPPYRLVDRDELAALPMGSVMEPYRQIALDRMEKGAQEDRMTCSMD